MKTSLQSLFQHKMSMLMLYFLSLLITSTKSQKFNKPDGSEIQFMRKTEEKAVYFDEKYYREPIKWSCPIPFVFDQSLAVPQQEVYQAMNYMKKMTGWTFVKRTNQDNYIVFQDKTGGCSSQFIGRSPYGGSQYINLASGCSTRGIIVHEIMHAIGAAHEHQRTDANRFRYVYETNVQNGRLIQFTIKQISNPGPYDYDSVMHYDKWAFADDQSKMTIKPTGDISDTCYIGQRFELTDLDIMHLNQLIDGPPCSTLSPDRCVPTNIVICGADSKINGLRFLFQEYQLFGTEGGRNRYRSKTTYKGYYFRIFWSDGWHVRWEGNDADYLKTTDRNLFTATWSQYNRAINDYEVDPPVSVSKVDCGAQRNCYVNVKSAIGLKSSDPNSYSDPYVKMYGKYKYDGKNYYLYKTTVKWNNEKNPIWNEEFYVSPADYDYLYFQVYDYDKATPNDYLGDTKVEDVDLNKLPCNSGRLFGLSLNNDHDGDKGKLLVNVLCRC